MMNPIDTKPSDKKLRQFAFAVAGILCVLGFLAEEESRWLWIAGGTLLLAVSWAVPRAFRIPFIVLSVLVWPIGAALFFVGAAAFFLILVTPYGWIGRMMGRDRLGRRWPPEEKSFWRDQTDTRSPSDYFRQF